MTRKTDIKHCQQFTGSTILSSIHSFHFPTLRFSLSATVLIAAEWLQHLQTLCPQTISKGQERGHSFLVLLSKTEIKTSQKVPNRLFHLCHYQNQITCPCISLSLTRIMEFSWLQNGENICKRHIWWKIVVWSLFSRLACLFLPCIGSSELFF